MSFLLDRSRLYIGLKLKGDIWSKERELGTISARMIKMQDGPECAHPGKVYK